jgi:hypothetical protein
MDKVQKPISSHTQYLFCTKNSRLSVCRSVTLVTLATVVSVVAMLPMVMLTLFTIPYYGYLPHLTSACANYVVLTVATLRSASVAHT